MPREKNHAESEKARTEPRIERRAAKKPALEHAGTDTEAFYSAQKESAEDSRDYAARRLRR